MENATQGTAAPGKGTVAAAAFLVGGTCIGGGMLALPVATGISGFVPSFVMMFFCWFAMTASALMLLEVSLWMEEGVHVSTMTFRILGRTGRAVSWLLYLFICYASIVAYTAGGGLQIAQALQSYVNLPVSKEMGCVLFVFFFGTIIYLGTQFVGRVNSVLFIAMIAAYFGLVGMGIDEVKLDLLSTMHWNNSLMAIPLLLTSFSFQTLVPSLTPYLKRNATSLRIAVVGGTSIAFLMYAVWQWLMLGIVPVDGPSGLAEALIKGEPATQFLKAHVVGTWIVHVAEFFAFFAIATSFLGIALGLFDFLSDGLRIKKAGFGKVLLGVLIVVPTLFFAIKYERVFLIALDTTGGFGDSILNGIIPVLMVWVGRYHLGYKEERFVPGGKPFLLLILCFFLFTLLLAVLAQTGHLRSVYDIYDILDINN